MKMQVWRKFAKRPPSWQTVKEFLSSSGSPLRLPLVRRKSSHDWLLRQAKDPYVKKAKIVSYRARSAFKLLEMDERFKIFKAGQVVVDLGAAPGSWSQVAVKKVNALVSPDAVADLRDSTLVHVQEEHLENAFQPIEEQIRRNLSHGKAKTSKDSDHGLVVGVDLLDISPLAGAIFIPNSDFTKAAVKKKIVRLLQGRPVDVVMSDMAPNATGVSQLDHEQIIQLCTEALIFSLNLLVDNGTFLCKIWTGQNDQLFRELLRKHFSLVRNVKPPASRGDSAELYLLGTGFKKSSHDKIN